MNHRENFLHFPLKEERRSMKHQWDIEESIEHFTLVAEDEELLANKTGATRLGFALLLKCFQLEEKFPSAKHEIPKDVVNYVAHQLKLEASLLVQYDWEGRTIELHRTQVREHYHFREATVVDTEEMTTWLISTTLAADQNMEHLKARVAERFRACQIEPPTPKRVERLIQTACVTYEQQFLRLCCNAFQSQHVNNSMPCSNGTKRKSQVS